jgi:hypothetical protein
VSERIAVGGTLVLGGGFAGGRQTLRQYLYSFCVKYKYLQAFLWFSACEN